MIVRRIIMLIIVLTGFFGTFLTGPLISANYMMEASPDAIGLSLVIGFALILFPRSDGQEIKGAFPGLIRRYMAVSIDFLVCTFFIFGLMFPFLLLVENVSRETWAWSWEHATSPFYTTALILNVLGIFVGFYAYFRLHLERNRATPGQYIMGYKIIPKGIPKYNHRIWHAFLVAGILGPLALFMGRKSNGSYPWDEKSNSQAVRVE